MGEHYDVIVIGTGAGGGTLARHLAPSGKRILRLEGARWRGLAAARAGELVHRGRVRGRPLRLARQLVRPKAKSFFQPQVHYFVGGATKLYGAALYRMREQDFGDLHHHDGISPAWPIPYQDMEPYYTAAEQLYQVHGARGEDPTDPPTSAPDPHPAVPHTPLPVKELSTDFVIRRPPLTIQLDSRRSMRGGPDQQGQQGEPEQPLQCHGAGSADSR